MTLRPETTGEAREARGGRPALALLTLIPLVWLLAVTMTAGVQKIGHPDPRIGFLAQAEALSEERPSLQRAVTAAKATGEAQAIEQAEQALHKNEVLRLNNLLDAAVAAGLLVLVSAIMLLSAHEWLMLLARRKPAVLYETEPVWLPAYAVNEAGRPLHLAGAAALAFALTKELSGEAEMERARQGAILCECEDRKDGHPADMNGNPVCKSDIRIYLETAEKRFNGVKRCC
jgi:carbon starvation protein